MPDKPFELFVDGEIGRNRMLAQRHAFWRSEKQAASDALKILNEDVGYSTLMNIIGNYLCCTILLWGRTSSLRVRHAIVNGLSNENSLAIWGESTASIDTIERWLTRGRKWAVEETSELFRLFISVTETIDESLPKETDDTKKAMEILKQLTLDQRDQRELLERLEQLEQLELLEIESNNYDFFNTDAKRYTSTFKRAVITREGWNALIKRIGKIKEARIDGIAVFSKTKVHGGPIQVDGPRSRKTVPGVLDRILGVKPEDVDSHRRIARLLANSSGGTNIHSIQPNSLCGILEWIFGLPAGADTSGTTAEVVAICGLLEDYLPKDELNTLAGGVPWYIGPVLSMVKAGHHTMLECAIAMTLSKEEPPIKYRLGAYESLIPERNSGDIELSIEVNKKLKEHSIRPDIKHKLPLFLLTQEAWIGAKENQANVSILGNTIVDNYSWPKGTKLKTWETYTTALLKKAATALAEAEHSVKEERKAVEDLQLSLSKLLLKEKEAPDISSETNRASTLHIIENTRNALDKKQEELQSKLSENQINNLNAKLIGKTLESEATPT